MLTAFASIDGELQIGFQRFSQGAPWFGWNGQPARYAGQLAQRKAEHFSNPRVCPPIAFSATGRLVADREQASCLFHQSKLVYISLLWTRRIFLRPVSWRKTHFRAERGELASILRKMGARISAANKYNS